MKPILKGLLLYLFSSTLCYGVDSTTQNLNKEVDQVLFSLEGWDNKLIKEQLTLRMEDNQLLINLLSEHKLGKTDPDTDESFQRYVSSLMEDQQNLAYIAGQLISISGKEHINLDGALAKKPLFHLRLKQELEENLGRKSSEILLFRMLYFSLMDKYAVR